MDEEGSVIDIQSMTGFGTALFKLLSGHELFASGTVETG